MTTPKPVDLEELLLFIHEHPFHISVKDISISLRTLDLIEEIQYLRTRVMELEDGPIEIDTSYDRIIRILIKKLEELTAENERLRDGK